MITTRKIATLFLLLAALCLSTWSIFTSEKSHWAFSTTDANIPDAIAENTTALVLNKQGTPAIKINTPFMRHYKTNDKTTIVNPEITVYRDSPNPWVIQSDYADSLHGMEQITFINNVKLQHQADKNNPETEMRTTSLTVYPDKKIAATDQPIVIIQPDATVHAIGMLANINEGTVKLLSSAQGEYASN